jgi:RNA polymerase sigma-70 factor, ECF subfamily
VQVLEGTPTRRGPTREERLRVAVDRWTPSLHGLTYRVLGDHGRAEEVVADAFAKLAEDPVLDRTEDDVAAWLRRVAFNGALNAARGERRARERIERVGRLDGTDRADGAGGALDPADEVLAAEERDTVRRVLASLADRHAAILLLRASGCSYAEVAATVGCAPGSVGTLLARAERAFTAAYTSATTGGLA